MNKYQNLLSRISKEFSIYKGENEEINKWKSRIIYSLLGRMALASLFDTDYGTEEEEDSSITHMKRRINKVFASYQDMYPELKTLLPMDSTELAEEMYDIFLNTGVIYHKPNRIVMSSKSDSIVNEIKFTRGYELDSKQKISGLGTYEQFLGQENIDQFINMFQLENIMLSQLWNIYTKKSKWDTVDINADIEYLRTKPPYNKGYWTNNIDKTGETSILKIKTKGTYLYYLYKYENKLYASELPQWLVENNNKRLLTNACLRKKDVLPPTKYRIDGDLVYIEFQYLPPQSVLYLWKLYSWPLLMNKLPYDFKRICDRKVFESIKTVMIQLGYEFIEE